jgi:hypothetical protein
MVEQDLVLEGSLIQPLAKQNYRQFIEFQPEEIMVDVKNLLMKLFELLLSESILRERMFIEFH